MSLWLGMVVDNLKQVVLGILKDHEDTFIFQYDLLKSYHIWMVEFGTQSHFSNGRLRQTRVLDQLPFFVGLEPDTNGLDGFLRETIMYSLLDGKLALLAIFPDRLVDTAICTTADEANNVIPLSDVDFACVATA